MTPAFALEVEGDNVTERVRRHLVELRVTLTADSASDSLQITLSDAPRVLARPAVERAMRLRLGYAETGLDALGTYYHSETDVDLVPRRLVLRATAADLRSASTLKAPRSRAWQGTTLGQVVADVAAEHGFAARVADELAAAPISHIDQTAESDLHLLLRVARYYDATLKCAGGALVVLRRGAGRSARGGALPVVRVDAGTAPVLSGRVSWRGRPRYASVQASYHNVSAGTLEHVVAGAGVPRYVIREPRPSRPEALAAARARLARLARQTGTLDLTMTGEPSLAAEARLITSGWGEGTDGTWTITRVTHTLGTMGFHSQVSAEAAL